MGRQTGGSTTRTGLRGPGARPEWPPADTRSDTSSDEDDGEAAGELDARISAWERMVEALGRAETRPRPPSDALRASIRERTETFRRRR
jgi:hypothetical protein